MEDKPIIDLQQQQVEHDIAKLPYEILKSEKGQILSVRRKSDQAVFDVGQPVGCTCGCNNTIKIASIGLLIHMVIVSNEGGTVSFPLESIKHHLKWEGQ